MHEAKIGSVVRFSAAIVKVEKRVASNGDYLILKLTDGTQKVDAKWWQYKGALPTTDKVYHVVAVVAEYQGKREYHISRMGIMDAADITGFRPHSKRDIQTMWEEAGALTGQISETTLRVVMQDIYLSSEKDIRDLPAAERMHHAYVGGLLEHSLEVTKGAILWGADLNKDLLIAGGLLHDIGKIFGYTWEGTAIKTLDTERLLGHITTGISLVMHVAARHNLDAETTQQLQHIIASHHGRLEWGSPVVPQTGEALMVHQADMASSRKAMFMETIEEEEAVDGWTGRHFGLGTKLYKGRD